MANIAPCPGSALPFVNTHLIHNIWACLRADKPLRNIQTRAGETRDKMLAAVRIVWSVFVFSYCLMICPQEQVVLQGHH